MSNRLRSRVWARTPVPRYDSGLRPSRSYHLVLPVECFCVPIHSIALLRNVLRGMHARSVFVDLVHLLLLTADYFSFSPFLPSSLVSPLLLYGGMNIFSLSFCLFLLWASEWRSFLLSDKRRATTTKVPCFRRSPPLSFASRLIFSL